MMVKPSNYQGGLNASNRVSHHCFTQLYRVLLDSIN